MEAKVENKTGAKSVKNYLDMLFNEEGLKTDLKVTITDETFIKIVAALIGAGVVVTVFGVLLKRMIKDEQLREISEKLQAIEGLIKK